MTHSRKSSEILKAMIILSPNRHMQLIGNYNDVLDHTSSETVQLAIYFFFGFIYHLILFSKQLFYRMEEETQVQRGLVTCSRTGLGYGVRTVSTVLPNLAKLCYFCLCQYLSCFLIEQLWVITSLTCSTTISSQRGCLQMSPLITLRFYLPLRAQTPKGRKYHSITSHTFSRYLSKHMVIAFLLKKKIPQNIRLVLPLPALVFFVLTRTIFQLFTLNHEMFGQYTLLQFP